MRELAERAWFLFSLTLGRLLRSGRYSEVRIDYQGGGFQVRKRRLFYAPLLVWMGDPLTRVMDTGVRILPQRDWEERERRIYRSLHGTAIQVAPSRTLVLPRLAGETLASLLGDPKVAESAKKRAIGLAVVALGEFHARGFTHGDAMAENVMIDLVAGVAHWFDFETIHDASHPIAWRRADDVRALLATSLLRTRRGQLAETLQLILDSYPDREVTGLAAASFTSVLRRPLAFHLGQAGFAFQRFREITLLLKERFGE
jgi:hypothetical protein